MHMHRLVIQNWLGVKALTVEADGKHVIFSGPNASGKSSAIDAIWCAIAGRNGRSVEQPIHTGSEEAQVSVTLDDGLVVERRWTAKGGRLVVKQGDGNHVRSPQALLDSLLSQYACDPVAFLGLRPQDQVDIVLGVCGVAHPVDEVQRITGVRYAPNPGESADAYLMRLGADETGIVYVQRREAGRQVLAAEKALHDEQGQLAGMAEIPAGDTTAVLAEIGRLQGEQQQRVDVIGAAREAQRKHETAEDRLAGLEAQLKELDKEAKALEDRLTEVRERQRVTLGRVTLGRDVVRQLQQDVATAQDEARELPDHSERIIELQSDLRRAEAGIKARARREHVQAQVARLQRDLGTAQAEHERLEEALAALRHLRAHLLDGVDLGIPGLQVDEGRLTVHGVPFSQASTSERLRVACAVAMRQRPKLALLRVDDAEHLDAKGRQALLEMAGRQGFQVIMATVATVADQQGLGVEIVQEGLDATG